MTKILQLDGRIKNGDTAATVVTLCGIVGAVSLAQVLFMARNHHIVSLAAGWSIAVCGSIALEYASAAVPRWLPRASWFTRTLVEFAVLAVGVSFAFFVTFGVMGMVMPH